MKIAGVIIAGGKSSRMGEEKALAMLGDKPLLTHIVERMTPQVDALALNANGDALRFRASGLSVIPDVLQMGTPLAGLHAALRWAKDNRFDAVLTVPSDAPFVPRDLAARLRGDVAAVAASGGQTHYLTGYWPTELFRLLEKVLVQDCHSRESGNPATFAEESGAPAFAGVTEMREVAARKRMMRVQDWVAACRARIVGWPAEPYDPFFNVNTRDELAEAERIAAKFKP